jgi:hypothetical protein
MVEDIAKFIKEKRALELSKDYQTRHQYKSPIELWDCKAAEKILQILVGRKKT